MEITVHQGSIAGEITAPASKSYAQRAIAAALLADAEHKKFAAVKPKRRYDFDF